MGWWMLAREVLRIRGVISRSPDSPWDVMPDLYFYRDPEDIEKEEQAQAALAQEQAVAQAPVQEWKADDEWNNHAAPAKVVEWGAEDPAQGNWEQTDQTAGW